MKISVPSIFTMLILMAPTVIANPLSLSEGEVQGYLSGKGMGMAKVAELNGYPGPAHVLELAGPLQLTASQKEATQALFDTMLSQAVELGKNLVQMEQELDQLFASRQVTEDKLAALLTKIGDCNARIRQTHIEAHLAQRSLLTEDQVARYRTLRAHHHH